MSLEQQVAALVDAANNLTSSVNGKMVQIDQKVDEATASVPDILRSLAENTVCVDAVDGDDNAGTGRAVSPFRTISRAGEELVGGTFTRILLKEGQEHVINGYGVSTPSGVIKFERWGDTGGVSRPSLRWISVYGGSSEANRGNAVSMRDGFVMFQSVNIVCENSDNTYPLYYLDGFFRNYQSNTSVLISSGTITLKDAPLFPSGSNAGRSQIGLYLDNVEVDVATNTNGKAKLIEGDSSIPALYSLAAKGVTLLNGITWPDLVFYSPNHPHVVTNIDTTAFV